MTPRERFMARVAAPDENGCTIWTGQININGYGRFWYRGKKIYAHRLAWEVANGLIPEGLDIDHLCRVRACVNPQHLEPVTRSVNVLRGDLPASNRLRARVAEVRTHCKRGHAFDAHNTYVYATGRRRCRVCATQKKRESRARQQVAS